jgi:hypothetical protein
MQRQDIPKAGIDEKRKGKGLAGHRDCLQPHGLICAGLWHSFLQIERPIIRFQISGDGTLIPQVYFEDGGYCLDFDDTAQDTFV